MTDADANANFDAETSTALRHRLLEALFAGPPPDEPEEVRSALVRAVFIVLDYDTEAVDELIQDLRWGMKHAEEYREAWGQTL